MIAFLNIGSNLGDRLSLIERAVADVEMHFNTKAVRAPLEYSEPWGFKSVNQFINLGIAIEVGDLVPEQVLDIIQKVETNIDPSPHRTPMGGYIDRAIDIDFVAFGDESFHFNSPRLTLPHPHLRDRVFFLRPFLYLIDNEELH